MSVLLKGVGIAVLSAAAALVLFLVVQVFMLAVASMNGGI